MDNTSEILAALNEKNVRRLLIGTSISVFLLVFGICLAAVALIALGLFIAGRIGSQEVIVIDTTLGVLALIMPKLPKFHAATKTEVDDLLKAMVKLAPLLERDEESSI